MGVSYQTGTLVRTGEERATLVPAHLSLFRVGVGGAVGRASLCPLRSQVVVPVAQHRFIAVLCAFAPLLLAPRKKAEFPMNIVLVFLFNLVMGVMISPALYFYGRTQPGLIGQAAVLTIGAFGILTLYAFVSRRDFSAWGSFLIVGLWVLIGTMFLSFFFNNASVNLWLAAVAVLLFSGLLVFDTWRLRNFYGPDEYVGAAVQIYLDLLNMFMAILRLTGNRRN